MLCATYTSTIHLVALERKRPCGESDAAIPTKKCTLSALHRVDQTVPCHCKLTHMVCNLNTCNCKIKSHWISTTPAAATDQKHEDELSSQDIKSAGTQQFPPLQGICMHT